MNRVDDQIWANCEGSGMTDWQCHLVAAGLIDCSLLLLTSPTTVLSPTSPHPSRLTHDPSSLLLLPRRSLPDPFHSCNVGSGSRT